MDGMFSTAPKVSSAPATQFVGILYAEDFDDPAEPDHNSVQNVQEPPPPVITQADVDAACADAVQAARLEWQAGLEQERQNAIASLNRVLGGISDNVERVSLEVAEGTVKTILAIVSGLLPQFCQQHGPAEVRALLGHLLPTIRSQERINVRVHPDLVGLVQRDLAELDPGVATMIDVVAAPLALGDVKVAWENGSMTRDSRQIAQAIQDALSQLGLHQPVEAPAKRRMAYAD